MTKEDIIAMEKNLLEVWNNMEHEKVEAKKVYVKTKDYNDGSKYQQFDRTCSALQQAIRELGALRKKF